MTTPLPPMMTAARFAAAQAAMTRIVGKDWVFFEATRLNGYGDHFAMRDPALHAASGAVCPASVEQVQRVLAVAREYGIPVWTVSTGRNLGYGAAAPRKPGCIVIDMKRMNRIIEVNEKHGYAVVEAGVSYFDLYRHLRKIGSKLWIDCAAPGWGGVVGNMLDRGVGYTPFGEHLMFQCGMQVVLSDGSVIETGLGSQPGRRAQHTYKYGRGPMMDGLFTQSNFGVVTRVGVHLMPEPPGYRPYMVSFPREEDLEQVIELLRPLKLAMLVPNAATTTELHWEAAAQVTRAEYYQGPAPLPPSARRRLMDDLQCGNWNFYGALYGSEREMDNAWQILEGEFRKVAGARFYFEKDKRGQPAFEYRAKLMRGEPNMTEFNTLNWIPNGAHVGFGPVIPVDGRIAQEQYEFVRDAANRRGFDYNGEFIIGWRDMHHIFMPIFPRDDEARKAEMVALLDELYTEAERRAQGIYRCHLDYMDRVAAMYSWNDGALARFNHRLKAALDETGLLAPGKSGIWPASGPGRRTA